MEPAYATSVFINCPFDGWYKPLFEAILFAVVDCGFRPRCSLEIDDGSQVRMEKIFDLVADCRFGIHDISRIDLDPASGLPRFNMPFELGVFLGANDPKQIISIIRNWLRSASGRAEIPGGSTIQSRYLLFRESLPDLCRQLKAREDELTFNDYTWLVSEWLRMGV